MRRGLIDATLGEPDSQQEVFDYFAGEILDRASPHNQQILFRLCFFPRFTEDQAIALSGDLQTARLLDYLYRRHLFVTRKSPSTGALLECDDVLSDPRTLLAPVRRAVSYEGVPSCSVPCCPGGMGVGSRRPGQCGGILPLPSRRAV